MFFNHGVSRGISEYPVHFYRHRLDDHRLCRWPMDFDAHSQWHHGRLLGLLLSTVLCGWVLLMHAMRMNWFWTVIPIPLVLMASNTLALGRLD